MDEELAINGGMPVRVMRGGEDSVLPQNVPQLYANQALHARYALHAR